MSSFFGVGAGCTWIHYGTILFSMHIYFYLFNIYHKVCVCTHMHIGDTSFNLFLASVSVELSLSS